MYLRDDVLKWMMLSKSTLGFNDLFQHKHLVYIIWNEQVIFNVHGLNFVYVTNVSLRFPLENLSYDRVKTVY